MCRTARIEQQVALSDMRGVEHDHRSFLSGYPRLVVPLTAVGLERCRRSRQRVDLVVRLPGEVTQRLVDVLIVEVSGATATVERPGGTTATIEISTLVDADREQGRRRSRRRFGYVVDAIGTFFR